MKRIGRVLLAVVAGAAVWAVLWVGGNQLAQAMLPSIVVPGEPLAHTGVLLTFIAYSVVLSVLAGWVAARFGGSRPMRAVWILAVLQLVLGIVIETASWSLLPVWYHIVFLALLVPATVYGGRLWSRRAMAHAAG